MTVYMKKYLKYVLMGILAATLSSIFFKKKTEDRVAARILPSERISDIFI